MARKVSATGAFDLHHFLPYRLAVAAERVSREFARRYGAEFGLTIPEWRVLAHLNNDSAVSVRDIEAQVMMEKSKVSRAATRLEKKGYLRKAGNAGDRRLVALELTDSGIALMAELIPLANKFQAELEAALGPKAQDFVDALNALRERD